jgi:catalase
MTNYKLVGHHPMLLILTPTYLDSVRIRFSFNFQLIPINVPINPHFNPISIHHYAFKRGINFAVVPVQSLSHF